MKLAAIPPAPASRADVLAVIPARLGAQRLPRKPLRLLAGVPLVVRVHQRVAEAGVARRIVVATDAAEVVEACRAYGVPVVLTDRAHPSGTDRVAEVAAHPDWTGADVVLNVQGDEPFVAPEALQAAVRVVASGAAPIGTVATPASTDVLGRPDVVKVVRRDDGLALWFSRAPIPYLREPEDHDLLRGVVRQHLGVYAYAPEALARWVAWPPHPLERIERLEQLRPLAHGVAVGVADVAPPLAGGVDTEDDLVRAGALWDAQFISPGAATAAAPSSGAPS